MSLAAGSRLAHYVVVEPLGEGGMGVVWRATDTTLGRDVALKVLPEHFADDPERMARFEREARLLAALNHPHIASIYGLTVADGVRFLAMELVPGEDLSQRIARGPVPVDEALPLLLQIAQALEHAHERGVIHRDLKPANIKLTADGQAKVLDFGLAKALEGDPQKPASGGLMTQSPTITGPMTAANVLLGTAAYMAPEQARGQAADRRADIWAFGAVSMEMLTGRRLFEGETISDTLASVLRNEINADALPAGTPRRVRALIRRCLERDQKKRLRDIGEARVLLEDVLAGVPDEAPSAPAPAAAPAARRGLPLPVVAGAGVAAGALLAFALLRVARPARVELPLAKFQVGVTAPEQPAPSNPALSPDGRTVAWLAGGKLMIQPLGEYQPRVITVAPGASRIFWSPDARQIGYIAETRIMKVAVTGGESQAICENRAPLSSGGGGAMWRDDGMIIFSRGDSAGILQVPAMGGDPTPVLKPNADESDLHEPFALPGGRGILFAAHRNKGGINNLTLWANGRRKVLLELEGQTIHWPVYAPSGHILFGRTPTTPGLWALPFSLARLEATGPPFLVTPEARAASVSRDGSLAFVPENGAEAMQMVWLDRTGRELGAIGDIDPHPTLNLALSPDGQKVTHASTDAENRDIWIYDTARGTRTRLTFEDSGDEDAAWSPDGQSIAYMGVKRGCSTPECYSVYLRRADGTGPVRKLADTAALPIFTPDGTHIIYTGVPRGFTSWDLVQVAVAGDPAPVTLITGHPQVADGRVSPHGRFLAYSSNESGHWEVYLTLYPGCTGRWQVSTNGGNWPRWNGAGDRLCFAQDDDVMEVEVGGAEAPVLGTPRKLFTRPRQGATRFNWQPVFDMTRDGNRFAVLKNQTASGHPNGVTVVQNWYAEFAARR